MPFHITSRTQWKEPLFRGAEDEIAALIRSSNDLSDAQLVAYAVMTNHIHVIVVQGRKPLATCMQPLLRRIALVVRRRRDRVGHVFAGRYRHSACQDPDYFRSMVAYVHLNPVRAAICREPGEYAWTSHRDYVEGPAGDAPPSFRHAVERGLRVFSTCSEQSLEDCRRDYAAYVTWRRTMDRYLSDDETEPWQPAPRTPLAVGGDLSWHEQYGTANGLRLERAERLPQRRADLRDHIRKVLVDVAPDLPIQLLRSGGRSRELVRARNEVIARALTAGYRATKIARFLNVSASAVSGVSAELRGRWTP